MFGRMLLTVVFSGVVTMSASAQVVIRAPFVRVETGGPGTYVRAPFVNLFVPSGPPPIIFGPPPVMIAPPGVPQPFPVDPGMAQLPPPRIVPQPLPVGPQAPNGEPPVNPDLAPPAPVQTAKAPTLQDFAKSFKAKAGNYEITLTNPINGRPEVVKFSLPGEPRNVRTNATSIEFVFGIRQFVRIEFDQDGPTVITR